MAKAKSDKRFYVYVLCDPRKPLDLRDGTEPLYLPELDLWLNYEPFYVGKGTGDRCNHHVKGAIKNKNMGNPRKFFKIKKILREGHEVIVINTKLYESENKAKELEMLAIKLIGRADLSNGPLTNLTDGGDGAPNLSEETRRKIGEANKARPNFAEHMALMNKLSSGMLGKRHSEKSKAILSEKSKLENLSDETIARKRKAARNRPAVKQATKDKRSRSLMGHEVTLATRNKISKSNTGKVRTEEVKNGCRKRRLGKKASDETRQRQSEAQKRHHAEHPVKQSTKDKISRARKGKPLSKAHCRALSDAHKGYKWKQSDIDKREATKRLNRQKTY